MMMIIYTYIFIGNNLDELRFLHFGLQKCDLTFWTSSRWMYSYARTGVRHQEASTARSYMHQGVVESMPRADHAPEVCISKFSICVRRLPIQSYFGTARQLGTQCAKKFGTAIKWQKNTIICQN
jgi:hypothetical protein